MRSDRTRVISRAAGYCGALALATVLAAGCAVNSGGTPTTGGSTPGASASVDAGGGPGGAPKIPSPQLDALKFWTKPCQLLRAGQVAALNVSGAGTTKDTKSGSSCTWENLDDPMAPRIQVEVSGNGKNGAEGLSTVYQNKDRVDGFEPTQVGGYPAVHGNTNNVGACDSMVGVQDRAMVVVTAYVHDTHSADYHAPCGYTDKIAQTVLQNLKAGS